MIPFIRNLRDINFCLFSNRSRYLSSKSNNLPLEIQKVDLFMKQLIQNPNSFEFFANLHQVIVEARKPTFELNVHKCSDTSNALIQSNYFNQKYFKTLKTLEAFEEGLKDSEEGIFLLKLDGSVFFTRSGKSEIFQGHAFVVFKIKVDDIFQYRMAHSYVLEYSLSEFLEKNEGYYETLDELKIEVINPISELIKIQSYWTKKEVDLLKKITGISSLHLIHTKPAFEENKKVCLADYLTLGRTTNIPSEFILSTYDDRGRLVMADYTTWLKENSRIE